ncbi:uncharacterized protein LOC117165187 [Bombus vancouverensis nearcticus]|uniref:uncharacterized protein LOC117165187 n=1 Tax=Bombus vancouverensis nearcticus TaxID=2705178 RepID=UPI00402BC51A
MLQQQGIGPRVVRKEVRRNKSTPERRRQTEPRLAKKKRGTARKKEGETKKKRKEEHKKMGTRYIVVVVLRNSVFAIDHCHRQGKKHEERRDGTRGIASRTEHRHETFHTAGSLIIVCPSYLTTYTGIYIHTKAN